jgi:hypothetical protein
MVTEELEVLVEQEVMLVTQELKDNQEMLEIQA